MKRIVFALVALCALTTLSAPAFAGHYDRGCYYPPRRYVSCLPHTHRPIHHYSIVQPYPRYSGYYGRRSCYPPQRLLRHGVHFGVRTPRFSVRFGH